MNVVIHFSVGSSSAQRENWLLLYDDEVLPSTYVYWMLLYLLIHMYHDSRMPLHTSYDLIMTMLMYNASLIKRQPSHPIHLLCWSIIRPRVSITTVDVIEDVLQDVNPCSTSTLENPDVMVIQISCAINETPHNDPYLAHQEDLEAVGLADYCYLVGTLAAAVVHHYDHGNLGLEACNHHHDDVQVIASDDVMAAGTSLGEGSCCIGWKVVGTGHNRHCHDYNSGFVVRIELVEELRDDEKVMEVVVLVAMEVVLLLGVVEYCSLVVPDLAENQGNPEPFPDQSHRSYRDHWYIDRLDLAQILGEGDHC